MGLCCCDGEGLPAVGGIKLMQGAIGTDVEEGFEGTCGGGG